MKRIDVPNSLRRPADEVEHLGLDRRVESGRRLVEDQERGIGRERHRDDDALLHAARELVRVAPHHGVGIGDLHLSEHRRSSARAPRRAPTPRTVKTSAIWVPIRSDGFSAAPGFW